MNTGKNTGSYNLEQTVLNTNLEAAREIPRQLRLRNLGGIIIIDFIDMRLEEDKLKVLEALEQNLSKDRIKNNIQPSTLGLFDVVVETKEVESNFRWCSLDLDVWRHKANKGRCWLA